MRVAIIIARKEIAQRLRDRTFFLLGLVAPLTLAFIFNLILGGVVAPGGGLSFDFGLVDEGAGSAGQGFEQTLMAMEERGIVTVHRFEDAAAGQLAADEGDVDAVFILPAAMADNFGAEITVIANVDSDLGSTVAVAIAEEFSRRAWVGAIAIRAGFDLGVVAPAEIEAAIAEAAAVPFPLDVAVEEITARQIDTATFFIAGLALFFTFFVVGTSITSMLQEKSNGTLSRLLAAPIRPASIVAGKMLAGVLLGIISMMVLLIASTFILGADWGNPIAAIGIVIATVIAAAGLMTLVGGLARTSEQAGNLQSIVALTMAMLGGTFIPIATGEGLLNTLRYLTPNAWYLRGLGDIAGGAYGEAMVAIGVLLAIGVVSGAIGLAIVHRLVRA